MASRLPLAHYRDVPAFLAATMAIRRQLADAEGLIGYALDADLLSKTFWTVSGWQSQAALDAFSRADPHKTRVTAIRPRMHPTTFCLLDSAWCRPTDLLGRGAQPHCRTGRCLTNLRDGDCLHESEDPSPVPTPVRRRPLAHAAPGPRKQRLFAAYRPIDEACWVVCS